MAIKDDIMQALEVDVIPLLTDEVWPDSYQVIGVTEVPDGAGGFTETESTVESGVCYRKRGTIRSGEQATADKLGYTAPVVVDLPVGSVITPSHTLTVNGVSLEVGEVHHDGHGNYGYKTVAICQEVSS